MNGISVADVQMLAFVAMLFGMLLTVLNITDDETFCSRCEHCIKARREKREQAEKRRLAKRAKRLGTPASPPEPVEEDVNGPPLSGPVL